MRSVAILVLCLSCLLSCTSEKKDQLKSNFTVIAHRGASGYLPEHTLEGAAMAHSWGVDYIEPDVVVTKDDKLVILHDHHIDTTTNVAEIFPNRAREDGRFYAVDFTLAEIKKLSAHERSKFETGEVYFPKRFPKMKSSFQVPSFREFIELVQGLNKSTGRSIGIYPEIKKPEFYANEGKDIAKLVLDVLREYGYEENGQAILQCFFPPTLKRLKNEFKTKIPLVQLIGSNAWGTNSADNNQLLTKEGLKEISTYAVGIGPWLAHLVKEDGDGYKITEVTKWAHEYGLTVHPFTHRLEQIPGFVANNNEFLDLLVHEIGVDGVFSDFADRVIDYLDN